MNEDLIEKLKRSVDTYNNIMSMVNNPSIDISKNEVFQKTYKGFYKVRRNDNWSSSYFDIFEKNKKNSKTITFESLLKELAYSQERCEASFISKMYATIDSTKAIIDSNVLKYFQLRLKRNGSIYDRIKNAIDIYEELTSKMKELLKSSKGKNAIRYFNSNIPKGKNISEIKKLDFMIYTQLINYIKG